MAKTKIICTLGPASSSPKIIKEMIAQGMSAARLNTAHGTFSEYEAIIHAVRSVSEIPIILDIKGPELRIKTKEAIPVQKGQEIEVGFSPKDPIYFNANCLKEIETGDTVLIQDGLLEATVSQKNGSSLILKFSSEEILRPDKNVTVLNRRLSIPPLSKKDKEAIAFACKQNIEYIALSYTRDKNDVVRVRKLLGDNPIGIISKIENQEGIDKIDEIIEHSDGIMIARGDLGVELPLEKVPLAQKELIKKCNQSGKMVITATQMLDSMIQNPRPTRAEVSDVANAIIDGSDAVMLSGETTTGKYPIRTVSVMRRIAEEVESKVISNVQEKHDTISDAITKSIYELTKAFKIDKIICITSSGYTARMISRFRINCPIIAVTPHKMIKRQLELYYGVIPLVSSIPERNIIPSVAKKSLQEKVISSNDIIVFTAAIRTQQKDVNLIEIHTISDLLAN